MDVLPVMGELASLVVSGMNMPFAWVLDFGAISLSIGDIACIMMIVVEIFVLLNDLMDGEGDDDGEPLGWYFFGDADDHISGWWR